MRISMQILMWIKINVLIYIPIAIRINEYRTGLRGEGGPMPQAFTFWGASAFSSCSVFKNKNFYTAKGGKY